MNGAAFTSRFIFTNSMKSIKERCKTLLYLYENSVQFFFAAICFSEDRFAFADRPSGRAVRATFPLL